MRLKLDKKSRIQLVVLLLLLGAGAGVYLWQQEDTFDLFGLLADPPATPASTASPPSPAPRPVRAEKPREETPIIPDAPAHGRLHNVDFRTERAQIESGVLTLSQGTDPLDTELTLDLRTRPWEVPSGRSFRILKQPAGPDTPRVRVRWHENGQSAPRQRDYTERYTLLLELGLERDGKIPGKIYLALPDEQKSQVAGTFEAEVHGFRLVDGKPDLSIDSIDTLQFLALRELLKDDPDRPLEDLLFRHGRLDMAISPPAGYLEVQYAAADGEPAVQTKFLYTKENGSWRLLRVLAADQLAEAHPYRAPVADDPPARLFPYLAAKRIETEVGKKHHGRLVNSVEFQVRHSDKHGIGVCEASYKLDEGQPVKTAFLFRRGPDGWRLVRELNKKERVNLARGKVETTR